MHLFLAFLDKHSSELLHIWVMCTVKWDHIWKGMVLILWLIISFHDIFLEQQLCKNDGKLNALVVKQVGLH